jgi:hypothetical protein
MERDVKPLKSLDQGGRRVGTTMLNLWDLRVGTCFLYDTGHGG